MNIDLNVVTLNHAACAFKEDQISDLSITAKIYQNEPRTPRKVMFAFLLSSSLMIVLTSFIKLELCIETINYSLTIESPLGIRFIFGSNCFPLGSTPKMDFS